MKSKMKGNIEDKYKKATNILWKIWWFFVFLFIIPSVITFLSFIIINFIAARVEIFAGPDTYVIVGLTVIVFIFSILFFYRFFDRYRDKPIFFNQENNLTARIHILYLITIFSLVVTPIFVFITPEEYQFELLPLISFCVLYNIVYFYISLKPIDYFDASERSFKRALKSSLSMKQPHNFLIVVNFFIQLIYLSLIFQTRISWLFALFTNFLFYIITLGSTSKTRKIISNSLKKDIRFLSELSTFKEKFASSILSLNFVLLIQIPFVILGVNSLQGISYSVVDFFNACIYAVLVFFLYLKFRIYFIINHKKFILSVS
jgi:hypothetical protein